MSPSNWDAHQEVGPLGLTLSLPLPSSVTLAKPTCLLDFCSFSCKMRYIPVAFLGLWLGKMFPVKVVFLRKHKCFLCNRPLWRGL